MKIDRILFQGKYCINSTFLDTTLQAEAVLEEGETMEEAMDKLKQRLDAKANSYRNPQLVQDAGLNFDFSKYHDISNSFKGVPNVIVPQPQIPEKNLQHEQIEIDIDNAQTREDLFALRERVPSSLVNHYMNRLKQLTK